MCIHLSHDLVRLPQRPTRRSELSRLRRKLWNGARNHTARAGPSTAAAVGEFAKKRYKWAARAKIACARSRLPTVTGLTRTSGFVYLTWTHRSYGPEYRMRLSWALMWGFSFSCTVWSKAEDTRPRPMNLQTDAVSGCCACYLYGEIKL